MVPQCRDELLLAHLRAALDPDLAPLLPQVFLRPVLVASGLAALAAGRAAAAGVRDPRRLLLALALAPERLVLLVVLDARAVIRGHLVLLSSAPFFPLSSDETSTWGLDRSTVAACAGAPSSSPPRRRSGPWAPRARRRSAARSGPTASSGRRARTSSSAAPARTCSTAAAASICSTAGPAATPSSAARAPIASRPTTTALVTPSAAARAAISPSPTSRTWSARAARRSHGGSLATRSPTREASTRRRWSRRASPSGGRS